MNENKYKNYYFCIKVYKLFLLFWNNILFEKTLWRRWVNITETQGGCVKEQNIFSIIFCKRTRIEHVMKGTTRPITWDS